MVSLARASRKQLPGPRRFLCPLNGSPTDLFYVRPRNQTRLQQSLRGALVAPGQRVDHAGVEEILK